MRLITDDKEFGEYLVCGRRRYRGHEPGTIFEAVLDPGAEQRAIARGDIRLLRRVKPELQPGSFTLPRGWLDNAAPTPTEAPTGSSVR